MLKFNVLIISAALILCAIVSVQSHGHSHDHDHHHDHVESNPAFKYSRAANEDPIIDEDEIREEEIVDLPPQKPKSANFHPHHDHHGHSHDHHGHSHNHHGHSHGGNQREPTPQEREELRRRLHQNWDDDEEEFSGRDVWFQAISATLLISAAPFFILFFIPLDNSAEKQWLLKILLSFASGGLLGDAFLHLIPHATSAVEAEVGHTHSHSHSHGDEGGHTHDMSVGLGVVSGIVAFLCVEKTVRIFNAGGGHGHSHGGVQAAKEVPAAEKKTDATEKKSPKVADAKDEKKSDEKSVEKKETEVSPNEETYEVKVAGYLNLFADCFHNFTDGLAIGASFIAGEGVGKITTLTILLHEVPHEIGDYAILIQSGMPPMRAIMMQLVTALGALTGCVFSLIAPRGIGEAAASAFILPFTAGGFIYIATVSVIPELLESAKLKQSILEVLALLSGVGMMVIIAQLE